MYVIIRIETGRPKRKSGLYVGHVLFGRKTRFRHEAGIYDIDDFNDIYRNEGPFIFGGLNFKLIPFNKDEESNV